jgi:hypothetical protein
VNRRGTIGTLLAFATFGKAAFANQITDKEFGLIGDGVAHDGAALARLITHVNSIGGDHVVHVRLRGHYLMAGAPKRPMAPRRHEHRIGNVVGLPALTRDNVAIDARGATFTVPTDFIFRRLKRGGDTRDSFFVLFQFKGQNCSLTGGVLDGSLDKRQVIRGPKSSGFGGHEFGLVMEGSGWQLSGVTAKNWGTDCLLVTASGRSIDGLYSKGRRNGVSVVAADEIPEDNPVIIQGGVLAQNGRYADHITNNPGAGAVVEGGAIATVIFRGIKFEDNNLKDLQLAKNSFRCEVRDCTFTHDLKLRPMQLGGHRILNNKFFGSAAILISSTIRGSEVVRVVGNTFEDGGRRQKIRFGLSRVSGSYFRQRIIRK